MKRTSLLRPAATPERKLHTVADQLDGLAAADMPLTGDDLMLLATTLRAIAGQLPSARPAPVLRLVAGMERTC